MNINEKANNREQVQFITRSLSSLFWGATLYKTKGARVSSELDGKLVQEDVTIVQSFATEADFSSKLVNAIDLAKILCAEMSQEAVSLEVDNKLYFVGAAA